MDQKALKFLNKTKLKPADILYFIREDRQTVIYLTSGGKLETYIPMKYLLAALPRGAFLNITKGVDVSTAEIASINGSVYTMRNGQQFTGRRRGSGEHKTNRHMLENRVIPENRVVSATVSERFSVLDRFPLATCVIEMVVNTVGVGVDFVVRYCNEAFLEQEGVTYEEAIDRSFFELFPGTDRKWLSAYSDIAANGETQVIRHTDAKTGDRIQVYCYQPMPGYCVATKFIEKDSKLSVRRIDE